MISISWLETFLPTLIVAVVVLSNLLWLIPRVRDLAARSYSLVSALVLTLLTVVIAIRWVRLEHGPFLSMYEILLSNLWSLNIVYLAFFVSFARLRPVTILVSPFFILLAIWWALVPAHDNQLPPTYATIWLYFHVLFGKVFLGLLLIATAVSGAGLARGRFPDWAAVRSLPENEVLAEYAYRFLLVSFIFESLMLIVGAIWAQDAWGRYWGWDPLETWAFVTWLVAAFTLHARAGTRASERMTGWLIIATFGLAFMTFFGVPFVSTAPHQGMV